jgi:hypothetical protein
VKKLLRRVLVPLLLLVPLTGCTGGLCIPMADGNAVCLMR